MIDFAKPEPPAPEPDDKFAAFDQLAASVAGIVPMECVADERSVVAFVLTNEAGRDTVLRGLVADDFVDAACGEAFLACQRLAAEAKPLSCVTFTDLWRSKGFDVKFPGALEQFVAARKQPPTFHDVGRVLKNSVRRQAFDVASKLMAASQRDEYLPALLLDACDATHRLLRRWLLIAGTLSV